VIEFLEAGIRGTRAVPAPPGWVFLIGFIVCGIAFHFHAKWKLHRWSKLDELPKPDDDKKSIE
jgi:hypothetical protein